MLRRQPLAPGSRKVPPDPPLCIPQIKRFEGWRQRGELDGWGVREGDGEYYKCVLFPTWHTSTQIPDESAEWFIEGTDLPPLLARFAWRTQWHLHTDRHGAVNRSHCSSPIQHLGMPPSPRKKTTETKIKNPRSAVHSSVAVRFFSFSPYLFYYLI